MTAGTVGPNKLSKAKHKALYVIGYTHIDSVWQWGEPETEQVVLESWASAVELMEEYPEMIFVGTSAAHYRMVEQQDPALFARIQELVRRKRWELGGGTVVEADCNLPDGEAAARQHLLGQRYLLEKFGKTALFAMNPDGFGHNIGQVQNSINGGAAMGYLFLRPQDHEVPGMPRAFWWEDNGGRRILCFHLTPEYGTGPVGLPRHVGINTQVLEDSDLEATIMFVGIGNHGGVWTRVLLEKLRHFQQTNRVPIQFTTIESFLGQLAEMNLPVVRGDALQHHARGCYATLASMKRELRHTGHMLRTAEKLFAMVELSGASESRKLAQVHYPRLQEAWGVYSWCQFHDLAAGSALKAGHRDANDQLGSVRATARQAIKEATQQVVWNIHTEQDDDIMPVTVFNPHPYVVALPVEADFNFPASRWPDARLFDSAGREVPYQWVEPVYGGTGNSRIVFEPNAPAFGWETFGLKRHTRGQRRASVKATDTRIHTPLVDLEIDPRNGDIKRLASPQLGHRILSGPAAVPVVIDDPTDTWGHSLVSYDGVRTHFGAAKVRLLETGPVRAIIRAVSRYDCRCSDERRCRCTRLIRDYIAYRQSGIFEIRVRLFWAEQAKALKLQFPYSLRDPQVVAEASYANVRDRTPNGEEEPCQEFVSVCGTRRDGSSGGFATVTDSLFSYSATPKTLELTCVRAPVYSHHDPGELDENHLDEQLWTDQGEHELTLRIVPFNGSWETAGLSRAGNELNEPLLYLNGTFRPKASLPQVMSLASLESPSEVTMSALKPHYDGEGRVVRLYNSGSNSTATFEVAGRKFLVEFGTEEVKTFLVPDDPEKEVREIDFLER